LSGRRALVALPLALVIAIGLGGCFSWRYHTWDDIRVDAGESTYARVFVAPHDGGPDVDVPFFLVGVENGLTIGAVRWDVKGKFNGPLTMSTDDELRDILLDGNCGDEGVEAGQLDGIDEWRAVQTGEPVDDRDAVNRLVETRVKVKAAADAVTSVNRVHIIVGGWEDDGDLTPEDPAASDDRYECGGGALTNLAVRGSE
jgi:hypothetical protein